MNILEKIGLSATQRKLVGCGLVVLAIIAGISGVTIDAVQGFPLGDGLKLMLLSPLLALVGWLILEDEKATASKVKAEQLIAEQGKHSLNQ